MKGGNDATNGSEITHSPLGEPKTSDACVLLPTDYCLKLYTYLLIILPSGRNFKGILNFFKK